MQVEIKKLPKSEIEITGEIPAEEFDKYWQKAVKELALEINVPGFRPGNAPERILVERVGEGAVLDEAAGLAIRKVYPDIVKDHKLDVIGPPRATITKIARSSPLGFKIKTAVMPEIELPQTFRKIAGEIAGKKKDIVVEEKEIDETLEQLKKMRTKEGEQPPELNDDFAKSVGNFGGLIDLKKALNENLKYEKEIKQKEKKRIEILDRIIKETKMEFPDILIEAEKLKMFEELKANITSMGMKWEDYLSHLKKEKDLSAEALAKAEKEILEGFKEPALKRVQYGLILEKLGQTIEIKVSEEEIEEKIKGFALKHQVGVDAEKLKDYACGIIKNEKVFSVLEGGSTPG